MTRNEWKEYLQKYKSDNAVSISLMKEILSDWNKNIEEINKKLNLLQDEIFKLNKDIN